MKKRITLLFALLVISASFGLFKWKTESVKSLSRINLEMLTLPEGDYYERGLDGTNWKEYKIVCVAYGEWSSNTEWYWDSSANVYLPVIGVGGGQGIGGGSGTSGTYAPMPFTKHVCGYGVGVCYVSAPDGHPCS